MNMPIDQSGGSGRIAELALWGCAGLLVLTVHVGAAAMLMQNPPVEAAESAPPAAIMIEMAAIPEAAQTEENQITPDLMESEDVKSDTAEPVEEPPPPEPEPEPEPVVQELPEPPPPEPMAELENVEVPLPVLRPLPEETKPEEKKPEPVKKVVRQQKPKPPAPATKAAQEAKADVQQSNRTAANQTLAGSSSSSSISPDRWKSRLYAHIKRRQRYPSQSRADRQEGTADISFQIDANGNVISVKLIRSSGFPLLDEEAIASIRRASPVPQPPPEANRLITVPMLFNLR